MRTFLLAGVAALVSGSCLEFGDPKYAFQSTEVRWRVDEQRDVAEWLEIEHGLGIEDEEHLSNLLDVVRGARVFPAHGGFLSFDLDLEQRVASEARRPPDEAVLAFQEFVSTFSIVEAAVVIDDEGRASLWRRGRLQNASEWLRRFEQGVLDAIAGSDEPSTVFPMPDLAFDDASWELLRAHVRGGGRVWRFEGDAVLLEVPMTQPNAERCIGELARPEVDASFRDGNLRLRYLSGPGGWIRSRWIERMDEQGSPEHDTGTVRRLVAAGATVEPVERYRERLADVGLR
jgi:hypothetical protein